MFNWGKVNSHVKWFTAAHNDPYFDLVSFCNNKGLNYRDVLGYIHIGELITSGKLDVTKDIKNELENCTRISQQLEIALT